MTLLPFSFDAPSGVRPLRPLCSLLVAAVLLTILGGCDAVQLRSSEDRERDADATEVQLADDAFKQMDLQYEPVSLDPGETFSIELIDEDNGGPVARTTHVGTPDGGHQLKVSFAPLAPKSVTIRCRNENTGTEQTIAERPGDTFDPGGGRQPVLKAEDDPDSYHYEEDENGNTTIVYDYDNVATGPTFDFPSEDEPVQCTHVAFDLNGATGLSPIGVRFSGDVEAPALRHRTVK